jgi:hypothetical protein
LRERFTGIFHSRRCQWAANNAIGDQANPPFHEQLRVNRAGSIAIEAIFEGMVQAIEAKVGGAAGIGPV